MPKPTNRLLPLTMTPYQRHVNKWKHCDKCFYSSTRTQVVLARGQLPCDILFVGEAPGVSEDVLGQPFKGPAGKLLDRIIGSALDSSGTLDDAGSPRRWRIAFTNIIACIPVDPITGAKATEPDWDCVVECGPRLEQIVEIAQPQLIVNVGKLAKDRMEPGTKQSIKSASGIPQVNITHPAAILRAQYAARGLMIQRCVVTIRNAAEELPPF